METTKILMEEHRVIERVLDVLETAAHRLRDGDLVQPAIFIQAVDFIKGFADGCHHRKEEGVLFPAMQSAGVPSEGGPIGVMLAEHQEARKLTSAMHTSAERLAVSDDDARAELIRFALLYVDLLRQHIAKEDTILFPMAERVLQGPALTEVSEAFERIEHLQTEEGVCDKFVELAADLEREVAK